jgi:hypothetical protein
LAVFDELFINDVQLNASKLRAPRYHMRVRGLAGSEALSGAAFTEGADVACTSYPSAFGLKLVACSRNCL